MVWVFGVFVSGFLCLGKKKNFGRQRHLFFKSCRTREEGFCVVEKRFALSGGFISRGKDFLKNKKRTEQRSFLYPHKWLKIKNMKLLGALKRSVFLPLLLLRFLSLAFYLSLLRLVTHAFFICALFAEFQKCCVGTMDGALNWASLVGTGTITQWQGTLWRNLR